MTRRGVLVGSAGVAATLALAACASSTDVDAAGSPTSAPSDTAGSQPTAGTPTAATSGAGEAVRLAGTRDFPVGGGAVVTTGAGPVVVTHPDDEEFLAFSGRCTHRGCTVKEVTENVILCDCHGSTFDGSTGGRLDGPATTGLAPVAIRVEGEGVYLA
ncbi:MAG: Rieske (2Fe-2S) protein [Candidatus Nanopelagicales bacterium]